MLCNDLFQDHAMIFLKSLLSDFKASDLVFGYDTTRTVTSSEYDASIFSNQKITSWVYNELEY